MRAGIVRGGGRDMQRGGGMDRAGVIGSKLVTMHSPSGATAAISPGEVHSVLRHHDAELLAEGRVEIVDVVEILAAVLPGLPHPADADEVEDDLAEIARRVQAPVAQHEAGHVTILLQGELANGHPARLPVPAHVSLRAGLFFLRLQPAGSLAASLLLWYRG